jgi:hypothetical protein
MSTYTAHRVNLNGSLASCERLNNQDEMLDWVARVYGKHANIQVRNDRTNEVRLFTDDGEKFVLVGKR